MVEATTTRPSIDSVDDLRKHLQWAIELEHATLPPYLCALYSLDPQRNSDAFALIGGVFVEEMLHLGLAANVMNAIGGRPRLDSPAVLQPYPRPLPHGDRSFELSLAPFDLEALETFLRLERPAGAGAPAETEHYETIGQFYTAIEDGLRGLCAELGERAVFSGHPARQVHAAAFRHTTGRLIAVDSLSTALTALAEIVDEGEGNGRDQVWSDDQDVLQPERAAVAHYYRFAELKLGRRYQPGDTPDTGPTGEVVSLDFDAVLPMRRNPRLADHPVGHPIRMAQHRFNVTYSTMLNQLEQTFNGGPTTLPEAVRTMYALKAQAAALMQMPDGDDHVAGPTFDYVPVGMRT
jgi:hypothetical protein